MTCDQSKQIEDLNTPDTENLNTGRVLSFGEPLVDHYVDYRQEWEEESWIPPEGESAVGNPPASVKQYVSQSFPGGRSSNHAVAAARAGAEAHIVGATGLSKLFPDRLEESNVSTDHLHLYDKPSECYIFLDDLGENRALRDGRGNMLDVGLLDQLDYKIAGEDVVLLSNGPTDQVQDSILKEAGKTGADVIYDPSPVQGADKFASRSEIDFLTPNEPEYEELSDLNPEAEWLKTKAKGVEHTDFEIESPEVEVVDTTGAGDTFAGYLAAGLADGIDLEDSCDRAVKAASLSVTKQGATPSVPWDSEVREL
jgi:ribokinase